MVQKNFWIMERDGLLFDSNKEDALLNSLIKFHSIDKNLVMNNYKIIAKKKL